jgi:nicotinate-nucleotide pyrophosphorylase (carboxylating)
MDNIISQIKPIIKRALDEDIGDGDVTTLCTMPPEVTLKGNLIAKEAGIISGLEAAKLTFSMIDEQVVFRSETTDGAQVVAGKVIARVSGPGRALLSAERVALNFLQRMSGIATLTRRFVDAVQDYPAVILDTRKTAPGLRLLDKWAVRDGGGQNHRIGLYDMTLIKDNHIAAVGNISDAVALVREKDKRKRLIEVEVKNLTELQETLDLKVDRILLDNMSLEEMRKAVKITNGRIPLEASGNVNIRNVADIAATGVDFISIGMLTHSAKALDISLLL